LCPDLYPQSADYENIFSGDFRRALSDIEKIRSVLREECGLFNVNPQLAEAVVFPELIRVSILRGKIEVAGLSLFYVKFGRAYSDFSAGVFQMKPSFIEELERYVTEEPRLGEFKNVFAYPDRVGEKDIRRERIARIFSAEWQCRYAALFLKALSLKFSFHGMSDDERVLFSASAYNYGFTRPYNKIKNAEKLEQFPYGKMSPVKQYSYADVSLWYYKRICNVHSVD
jgi:hypothetical protein